jgi:hypothetical protein
VRTSIPIVRRSEAYGKLSAARISKERSSASKTTRDVLRVDRTQDDKELVGRLLFGVRAGRSAEAPVAQLERWHSGGSSPFSGLWRNSHLLSDLFESLGQSLVTSCLKDADWPAFVRLFRGIEGLRPLRNGQTARGIIHNTSM